MLEFPQKSFIKFTKSESRLLSMLTSGLSDREIADTLHFSYSYVSCKLCRMFKKYKLKNRCHLVAIFVHSLYSSNA
ncbi:MAG: helix-turn-helix transcriptional regulator [Okeania sp. SIO1I7]|nr:helix-turn-helix transcriptional regulator [Okeania sp. SIO1I7]